MRRSKKKRICPLTGVSKLDFLLELQMLQQRVRGSNQGFLGFQTNFYGQQKPYLGYVVDVLWCQPIKLIQVVSTLDFINIEGTNLILFFCPLQLLRGL